EAVAAEEDSEAKVEVGLGVERPSALEAEGVAGELDRVEGRQAVRDGEFDVGRVEGRLDSRTRDLGESDRDLEELGETEHDGELTQVALSEMSLAATLEGMGVAAQAVALDPGVDRAAERPPAAERAGVFLELGALERQARGIARRGVQAHPA